METNKTPTGAALRFELTLVQYAELAGLASWVATDYYWRERGGLGAGEMEKIHQTILDYFPRLDALGVPFWVQNSAIIFGEDWRRESREYFWYYLSKKNIEVK